MYLYVINYAKAPGSGWREVWCGREVGRSGGPEVRRSGARGTGLKVLKMGRLRLAFEGTRFVMLQRFAA